MMVRGGIRARWAQTGWERGAYGYPTSDELNISQSPWQWYSDFQNGVIFFEGGGVVEPATAGLPGAQVLAAFAGAFRRRTADDARRDVALSARQAGVIGIHVDNFAGIGVGDVANALHDKLAAVFNRPIPLGSVPAAAGLLSFKVMKDGGLTLYFRPDVAGRFAAGVAQTMLNNIGI